jgi:hypothetical protein
MSFTLRCQSRECVARMRHACSLFWHLPQRLNAFMRMQQCDASVQDRRAPFCLYILAATAIHFPQLLISCSQGRRCTVQCLDSQLFGCSNSMRHSLNKLPQEQAVCGHACMQTVTPFWSLSEVLTVIGRHCLRSGTQAPATWHQSEGPLYGQASDH